MSTASSTKLDRRYLELVRQFPLRPIRTKRELASAMKIAGHLATYDERTLGVGEQDYLDALTILIEDYQRQHALNLPEIEPRIMLKHLMEQRDMSVADLGRVIGSQSILCAGLNDAFRRLTSFRKHWQYNRLRRTSKMSHCRPRTV